MPRGWIENVPDFGIGVTRSVRKIHFSRPWIHGVQKDGELIESSSELTQNERTENG